MAKEIWLIHHSHTDIGYTHPRPIVFELQRRFLDDALDLIELNMSSASPSPTVRPPPSCTACTPARRSYGCSHAINEPRRYAARRLPQFAAAFGSVGGHAFRDGGGDS